MLFQTASGCIPVCIFAPKLALLYSSSRFPHEFAVAGREFVLWARFVQGSRSRLIIVSVRPRYACFCLYKLARFANHFTKVTISRRLPALSTQWPPTPLHQLQRHSSKVPPRLVAVVSCARFVFARLYAVLARLPYPDSPTYDRGPVPKLVPHPCQHFQDSSRLKKSLP